MTHMIKGRIAVQRQHSGMTMMEIMVVLGILIFLTMLILPVLAKARTEARKTQCASNLKQLGYALVMYQSFEGRDQNAFPERLTHLADLKHQYVTDERLFVCPMDTTRAAAKSFAPYNDRPSENPANKFLNVIKPILSRGTPPFYSDSIP